MILEEVENGIAKCFYQNYLSEEVTMKVEDKLLSTYITRRKENIDHDELVNWTIGIIDEQLKGKVFR